MSFVRGVWDIFSGILDSGVRVVQGGWVRVVSNSPAF